MAMLGQYIDPRALDPTAPPPPDSLGGALGAPAAPQAESFRGLLQSPEMMAFLMQAATSMLAQQGIGPSIAQGAGAMGRAATSRYQTQAAEEERAAEQAELDRQYGLEERRVAAYETQVSRAGGGGGGGKSSSKTKTSTTAKDLRKMLLAQAKAEWEAAGDPLAPEPSEMDFVDEAERLAKARENGMPLDIYGDLRRGHGREVSDQFINDWVSNPQAALEELTIATSPPPQTPMTEAPTLAPPEISPPALAKPGEPPPKPKAQSPAKPKYKSPREGY